MSYNNKYKDIISVITDIKIYEYNNTINKMRHNIVKIPHSNASMKPLNRHLNGGGYGSVLLDGGLGGQSSYYSTEDYESTTGRKLFTEKPKSKGGELADRIAPKLSKLSIENKTSKSGKPLKKNITMAF